jgi:hypothetical protein
MKQLITALILVATAATAQAADISLNCSYTGVDGSAMSRVVQLNTTSNGASIGTQQYSLRAFGNQYVLVGRIGDEHTINRETLAYKIEAFGNKMTGSCVVAQSNNKI